MRAISKYGLVRAKGAAPITGIIPTAYPNSTVNPYWSDYKFMVDLGWYYDIGVRPGDTVYDLTGRHQFTIPSNGTLSSDGFTANSNSLSDKIQLAASSDFARTGMWAAGLIYNPLTSTYNQVRPFAAWQSPNFEWEIGRSSGSAFPLNYGDVSGGPSNFTVNVDQEYMASIHWVDKVRLFVTDNTYDVSYGSNPSDYSGSFAVELGDSGGVTRCAWVAQNASATAGPNYYNAGTTGATAIPSRLEANGDGVFDPTDGSWS